jgi:hypothetical protein
VLVSVVRWPGALVVRLARVLVRVRGRLLVPLP